MSRFIRILIKLVLAMVVLFIFSGAMAFLEALGGGGATERMIIMLGAIGALTAIVKYKPKEPETSLDKSE